MHSEELMTSGRVAELIGRSDSYVRDLAAAGTIPVAKRVATSSGRVINLFDRAAVERFLATPRPGPGRPKSAK